MKGCKQDVLARLAAAMNFPPIATSGRASVRLVRDVAPRKTMLCISFALPKEVAFATADEVARPAKRARHSE